MYLYICVCVTNSSYLVLSCVSICSYIRISLISLLHYIAVYFDMIYFTILSPLKSYPMMLYYIIGLYHMTLEYAAILIIQLYSTIILYSVCPPACIDRRIHTQRELFIHVSVYSCSMCHH